MSTSGTRIGIIAVLAAVIAALGPAAPTGNGVVDAVLVGGGTAVVVLAGALAPWWAVTVAAGLALSIAMDPLLVVLALAGLVAALWVGSTRRVRPDVLAASIAVTFNVLGRAHLGELLGLSAAITGVVAILLFVTGIGQRPKRVRRLAWAAVGLAALVTIGSAASFGYAAYQARHDLSNGMTTAERGVTALERGDFEAATTYFQKASDSLARAHDRLTSPLTLTASTVPVVAQHRTVLVDMSAAGASGAATVSDALRTIDLDKLRSVDGSIDVDELASLQAPLTRVKDALVELRHAVAQSRSPWLVSTATNDLDDFGATIDEHLPSLENALQAIDLGPQLLGSDQPKTYLVLFTTPSESRGLGGFIGSYGELTIDHGKLSLGDVGRAQDLDLAAKQAGAVVHGHAEFLAQYGRFGFDTNGTGSVGDAAFRNLAMTPNFPWVGEIASDLYQQTTGRKVDGVIAIDPFVVASLLKYTGPIQLSSIDTTLTADTATQYLLHDQYVLANGDQEARADSLGEAASLTFKALVGGSLPDPITLARDLGPLVGQRRLLLWSADAGQQQLLQRVGAAGTIPSLGTSDGWAFTLTNGGGNKIDSYLQRSAKFTSSTDPSTGETTATMRLQLTNSAPSDGAPAYVIGNRLGLPKGTSRLYLSAYSALGLTGLTVDGKAVGVAAGQETGWNVYSAFVDIPAGATVTIEVQLHGHVVDPGKVVTFTQPMSSPLERL
jgi:hypothetical protein